VEIRHYLKKEGLLRLRGLWNPSLPSESGITSNNGSDVHV
jgi:hypothetical protein